jgi:hypothetical protein
VRIKTHLEGGRAARHILFRGKTSCYHNNNKLYLNLPFTRRKGCRGPSQLQAAQELKFNPNPKPNDDELTERKVLL